METPILTPMQQAIEQLQKYNRIVFGEYMKDDGTNENELVSKVNGLLTAIRILKNHLPKEQEAIEQAYSAGSLNKTENILLDKTKVTAEQYFNQTYKETPKQTVDESPHPNLS